MYTHTHTHTHIYIYTQDFQKKIQEKAGASSISRSHRLRYKLLRQLKASRNYRMRLQSFRNNFNGRTVRGIYCIFRDIKQYCRYVEAHEERVYLNWRRNS